MQLTKAIRSEAEHKRYVLGAHPIIQMFIDRLKIREIIAAHIKQDQRIKLSCEKIITLMIHNILTEPSALYEVKEWLEPLDEKKLDLDRSECEMIYDDRIGKALEDFYNGNHQDVFFHLALRAIKIFHLECSQIHQDTTSVTVTGRYEGWNLPERLCHGHNKDHRPDLKQLVLGTSVTSDGAVPLIHKVYSGNQTDDQLHAYNHRRLRRLLQHTDFIYVADCKLATAANLREISACDGRFVSVMPRSWKEDADFRKKLSAKKIRWKHILSRPNNRKPDSKVDRYYVACGEFETSQKYSLIWLRSTQKAELDKQTREAHIRRALDQLSDIQTRLNRYKLKTHAAIKDACETVLSKCECQELIEFKIHTHRSFRIKHRGKGRPSKNDQGEKLWSQYFSLAFSLKEEACKETELTDGVFPLITNIAADHTPKQILEIYKYQPFLETRHSQYKTYQEMSCVFLKKPQRVVGVLHVHFISLMVATLIERQLRQGMKKHNITDLAIYPEKNPCPFPTMFDIARLFKNVEKYVVENQGKIIVFPPMLSPEQIKVLQLLEVPISLYH